MSYFENHYNRLSYPIAKSNIDRGLRNAQLGAIHAIASHFTLYKNTIALVVMPTGSGKTAVITLSPYVLNAKRVLVLSSSVLVRGQIFDKFSSLSTLKEIKVLPEKIENPKTFELRGTIKSLEEWENLKVHDVVITIPQNIAQSIKNGYPPPEDLFDLIIVDEAHHSKASTWNKTIKYFKQAKKISFTATPFRNDRREVEGKIIYKYSLSQAHKDGIFGDIGYIPVELNDNVNIDVALAKEAQRVYKEDNSQNGFNHRLMVRTEGIKHAKVLEKIYRDNTSLKMKIVNSSIRYPIIKKTIAELREGKLDGIICNNMLGEGFDFPNLKIAAIHKPHSSLPITLQFIGRFARTNAENISDAKFIAPTNDIKIAKKELYHHESIWQEIIHEISDVVIDEIDFIKKTLDSFTSVEEIESDDDFSMFNLFPYFHLKIFHADTFFPNEEFEISNHKTLFHKVSEELQAVILLTLESKKPKWVKTQELNDRKHHLFVIFFDAKFDLIYLCSSSIRSKSLYKTIAEIFTGDSFEKLSKSEISKVLLDIENPEIFNLGMASRNPQGGESYRQLSGKNTGPKVKATDGKLYFAGHIFSKGTENNKEITIGYSSGSKVWRHSYEQIPTLIEWCKHLSKKIKSDRLVNTKTGFDHLSSGKIVNKFPSEIVYVTWNSDSFKNPINFKILKNDELVEEVLFGECVLKVDQEKSTSEKVALLLCTRSLIVHISYSFDIHYQVFYEGNTDIVTEDGESLKDYLNDNSLQFVLSDFSNIIDNEWYPIPSVESFDFNLDNFRVIDWESLKVDINFEFYESPEDKMANENRLSIHEGMEKMLLDSDEVDVLIYDHGPFELADLIAIRISVDRVVFSLYHVKRTKEVTPGLRVTEIDELVSQCLRCTNWISNRTILNGKISKRLKNNGHKIVKGSLQDVQEVLGSDKLVDFNIILVQPGLSKLRMSTLNQEERKISNAFAHLESTIQQTASKFMVIGSK